MYRITYEQGNGYRCGCCRSSHTESCDYNTREGVMDWLYDLEVSKQVPSDYGDDDDRELIEIREIKDEDLTKTFILDPEQVKRMIEYRRSFKKEEKEKEKQKEEKDKINQEKKMLKNLIKKYPDEITKGE